MFSCNRKRDAMIVLPRKIRTAISAVVAAAAKQGELVQVYFESKFAAPISWIMLRLIFAAGLAKAK
jgi:hypothetical protein